MSHGDPCTACNGTGQQVTVYAVGTPAQVEDEHPCQRCFGAGYEGGAQDLIDAGQAELAEIRKLPGVTPRAM